MDNFRKLLVAGVNEALAQGKFSLNVSGSDARVEEQGHFFTQIGGYPSVVLWSDIGFGELRVSVWWNYDHSKHPQSNAKGNALEQFILDSPLAKRARYPDFVGAFACGWLERKAGKYLQGEGKGGIYKSYIRKDMKVALNDMPVPVAQGFKPQGQVHF